MPITQYLSTREISRSDLGDQNPDELVEARAKMVMEKSVFQLLPKILHIHRGSETREVR
jgi:hypothetical protein